MKYSPFILINHHIRQTYEPVGSWQDVMDGLERALKICSEAQDYFGTNENLMQYSEWIEQCRQENFLNGFKRCVLKHPAHLLMLELVCEDDIAKHPAQWVQLRAALMTELSILRQKVAPSQNQNIVH